MLSSTAALAVVLTPIGFFLLYRAALPKPIPGIPYVPGTEKTPLGNLPHAFAHKAKAGRISSYFFTAPMDLGVPVCQIFMGPFSRPWVMVVDGQEAHDVMVHRFKEFERGDFVIDLHKVAWPNTLPSLKTNERWRATRHMLGETITSKYISGVAVPAMARTANEFIDLLHAKCRLAKGSPFDVREDLKAATADIIWRFAYGNELGAVAAQIGAVAEFQQLDPKILATRTPELLEATVQVSASSQLAVESPLGWVHQWLLFKLSPRLRSATGKQDARINRDVARALQRLKEDKLSSDESMLASMLNRLHSTYGKDIPSSEIKILHGELALMQHAGQKTTADTIGWALKYLAVHQDFQGRVRSELKKVFAGEDAIPQEEIASASLPHYDAFAHEVLRYMPIIPAHVRMAVNNTQILGHHIPKGTQIFLPPSGPSYNRPPVPVDDSKRSSTANSKMWQHQHTDLEYFRPDRWLRTREDGSVDFDPRAAPMLAFADGQRACWGQKFAMIELRVIICTLLWYFEIAKLPDHLTNFDAVDFLTIEPANVLVKLKVVS